MRKRVQQCLTLALLLSSLTAPAAAVESIGIEGLSSAEARSFGEVLARYRKAENNTWVIWADLRDMTADQKPDPLVISIPRRSFMHDTARVEVWAIRDGEAVRVGVSSHQAGSGGTSAIPKTRDMCT